MSKANKGLSFNIIWSRVVNTCLINPVHCSLTVPIEVINQKYKNCIHQFDQLIKNEYMQIDYCELTLSILNSIKTSEMEIL